jgi:hypothetical protein
MLHRQLYGTRPIVFLLAAVCALAILSLAQPTAAVTLIPISGTSPYPDGGDPTDPEAVTECNGGNQVGTLYRNSETEPFIAVNPTNVDNMIACWHQDRWSNGSAQGVAGAYTMDAGATWTHFSIGFTRCSGGAPGSTGDYQRASDPWISFGADGAAYYMALVSDRTTARNGMAAAKSTDGGATWTDPIIIKSNNARGANAVSHFHDKNTLTADPYNPNLVYATWTLFRNRSYALLFSRSTDGGMTWGPARPVNKKEIVGDHETVYFRQGAQIVVLPDGTLLNVFFRNTYDPRGGGSDGRVEMAIFRSRDQGHHWEKSDTPVADMAPTGAIDVYLLIELGIYYPVRDAGTLPDIAVDRNNGNIYIVWQDGRFSPYGLSAAVISRSTDGGDTWSSPIPVHDVSDELHQGFLPVVAVADNGIVGVLFYDFRNDNFGDATLDTDVFLTMLGPDLNFLSETRLTEDSFDMRQMLITGFRGYFPGDYVGLDAADHEFVAAFTVANNLGLPLQLPWEQDQTVLAVDTHNRQDIVFARVPSRPKDEGITSRGTRGGGDIALSPRGSGLSAGVVLHNSVPNPFNPTTVIAFDLPDAATVNLDVYDVSGRRVQTLVGGRSYPAGTHHVRWDGRNAGGQSVASGVYLYRLNANGFAQTKRMVLMK